MFSRRSPVEVEGKAERLRSATTVDNQIRSKTMKRITFAVTTALILGALTLALPKLKSDAKANPVAKPAAPQIGPDACKNVKFQFKNNRSNGEIIRAQKIEYHQLVKNNWRTELVEFSTSNGECGNGSICTTKGDNLADSKGVQLDKIKLHFQWKSTKPGSNWSDTIVSSVKTVASSEQVCTENKYYGGSEWIIGVQ
jgi:hypothetical protein